MPTITGTSTADTLNGTVSDDVIQGLGGNDTIDAGPGHDDVDGGEGNDVILGGAGNDVLRGGYGEDNIRGEAGNDTIYGDDDNDVIYDREGDNYIYGGSGNDRITVGPGTNFVFGGDGDDSIESEGSFGSNTIDGGAGDDNLYSMMGTQSDYLIGGIGNDALSGGQYDTLDGGDGSDIFYANFGADVIAGAGDDTVRMYITGVYSDQAFVSLGSGQDRLFLTASFDAPGLRPIVVSDFVTAIGGDTFDFSGLATSFVGWDGNSNPFENGFARLLGSGADTLFQVDLDGTGTSRDFVTVAIFRDVAAGTFTSSSLSPGFSPRVYNLIEGTPSEDILQGTAGGDVIIGSDGRDVITGGAGSDFLSGGSGADAFADTSGGLNGDTITDFTRGDRIVISNVDISTFAWSLSGNVLTYTGGSVSLGQAPTDRLTASRSATGGVQIAFADVNSDFNGDGRSDILLQSTTGAITVWRGSGNGGLVPTNGLAANSLDASWRVAGVGDFNGDGRDDILWRHSSGVIGEWLGQTGVFTNNSGVAANAVDNSWSVVGVADYNGDGRDDILWRHSSGEIGEWLAQANGSFANNGGAAANFVDPSWTVMASGDFNGDGSADILWRHTSGVFAEWQGSASGRLNNVGGVLGAATGSVVGSGDFNGDGRDDILMRNATSGALTVWLGQSSGQFTAMTPGNQVGDSNWRIADIGDFNGDGRDDLFWRHSSGAGVEWLGTATGDFAHNGAVSSVPSGWAVQSPDIWFN